VNYFVIGGDGKEYGPVDSGTLKSWVTEQRVGPQSQVRDVNTGRIMPASQVPGLFAASGGGAGVAPPVDWSQPPAMYPRPNAFAKVDDGKSDLIWAIARSALAIVFFFVIHGLGFIVGAYAVMYAFRAHSKGHRHGKTAIAISISAMVIIGIGWALRLKGIGV